MSAADLSDTEIQQAFNEIKGATSQTNWICLGYVPKSDTKLKVAGQGSGGLKEFTDELSAGKILYGLLSFSINNTKKFVYVAWCGEGVIGLKKGLFNNHSNDVAKVFKGFHVQINARAEEDLNEQKILERLKKATGASYDSGAKIQGNASTSLPTNVREGQKLATASNASVKVADKSDYKKDDESKQFWAQQREEQTATKAAKATPNRADYNKANESKQFWAQQKQQEEEEKAAKAASQAKPKDFANTSERQQFWNQQRQEQAAPAPKPAVKSTSAAPGRPAPPKAAAPPPPEPEPEPEQSWEEPQQTYDEPQQTYEEPQQTYEEPQQTYEEQSWEEPQQTYEEPQQNYEQSYEQSYEEPQQNYDQSYEQTEQTEQTWDDSQQQTGLGQVRALYDFDPENADDLGFREGEIISLLDNSDPSGWWQGEVNGKIGFFPSNFVEIVQ